MLMLWRGRNLSWCKVCPEPRFLVLVTDPRFFIKQLHFGFGWNKSNLMKKFLLLLSVFALFSCSSDESKSDSNNSTNDNYIEYNGEKYYFTEATIKRVYENNSGSTSFILAFTNNPMTSYFQVELSTSCKQCPVTDLISTTYTLNSNAYIRAMGLGKFKNDTYINILSKESLTTTVINSIIVTNNSNGNYGFKFSFITPTGTATGEYLGELKKLNY